MITKAQRDTLVANFEWMYAHGGRFAYAQQRPFKIRSKAALTTLFLEEATINGLDCAAFTIQGFFISGLKDPSGQNFDGLGNTSTMLAHLPHTFDPRKADKGALALFGADLPLSEQHVAVLVTGGVENPMLISHGQPGVKRLTLAEEQTAHKGTTAFLSPEPLG